MEQEVKTFSQAVSGEVYGYSNPLFPALRSGPTTAPGASPKANS